MKWRRKTGGFRSEHRTQHPNSGLSRKIRDGWQTLEAVAALAIDTAGPMPCHFQPGPIPCNGQVGM